MPTISRPLSTLSAWTAAFRYAEIPVLADTAVALESLRENEDAVDANTLGELIAGDPLMSLKLLAYASAHRHRRIVTDTETVTATLVMMGIGPFFRAFGPQPTVEDQFAADPQALAGVNDVLRRSHRAARFALAFAVHRLDHDAAVIHLAALLHDFAELLLWCHASPLALELRRRQLADPTLRSAETQREVLNIVLADLEQSLMRAWALPDLLVRITDDRHTTDAQVLTVKLAHQLARHTMTGWGNAALPDDVAAIGELLNLAPGPTLTLLKKIDS